MFYSVAKTVMARKEHQCTYCCEFINKGDEYVTWNSVDDSWFTNKMHPECADDFYSEGDGEYCPYSNERPQP